MFKNLDIPFCRKVLEFAENEHPDFLHRQEIFYEHVSPKQTDLHDSFVVDFGIECGTVACMAGIAAIVSPDVEIKDGEPYLKGELLYWGEAGQELMGLTNDQADRLFQRTCDELHPEKAAKDLLRSYIEGAEKERA